jgi:predicted DCC family thiol-disulfide oxidoreductase YuxK
MERAYTFAALRLAAGLGLLMLFGERLLSGSWTLLDTQPGEALNSLPGQWIAWLSTHGWLSGAWLFGCLLGLALALGWRRLPAALTWVLYVGSSEDMPFWRDLDRVFLPWLLFLLVALPAGEPAILRSFRPELWKNRRALQLRRLLLAMTPPLLSLVLLAQIALDPAGPFRREHAAAFPPLASFLTSLAEEHLSHLDRLFFLLQMAASFLLLWPRQRAFTIGLLLVSHWLIALAGLAPLPFALTLLALLCLPRARPQAEKVLIFFDGSCAFCSRLIRFLLEEEPTGQWHYAPLQGHYAQRKLGEDAGRSDALRVLAGQQKWTGGKAVLFLLKNIGGPWRPLGFFLGLLPAALVDWGYKMVAKWRFRLAAAGDLCANLQEGELRGRFHP